MAEKSQKKEETPIFCFLLSVMTNRGYRSPRRVTRLSVVQPLNAHFFTATAATAHRSNFTSDNKLLVWDI